MLKILIDYPSPEAELEIVARWDAGFNSRRLEQIDVLPLADVAAIQHCRAEIRQMRMEPGVQKYIVEVIRKTRSHPTILYGASPRASVALLLCSKALAAIRDAILSRLTIFVMLPPRFCVIVLPYAPKPNSTVQQLMQ